MNELNKIRILNKNADFLVVYKPQGMSFHAESESEGFIESLYQLTSYKALYPVHRLDKMTSGLCVVALNKAAAQTFGRLFEAKEVHKLYVAISDKKPKKKQGTVKGSMAPSRRGQWKLTKGNENYVETKFVSCLLSPGKRLYFLEPKTGKTHQLRVAMKSLGAPILGDVRYSGSVADRGYLHACYLSFNWNGEKRSFFQLPDASTEFNCDANVLIQHFYDESLLIK
ncbi:pseudouridine synthase [Marinomonas sp. 2405UD68-3]|uniref:pseudouridine synthase n=1 Tax=Marinomonas sp. 2405UD68-3 TaxID=3391835 RepID=UPI0039C8C1B3